MMAPPSPSETISGYSSLSVTVATGTPFSCHYACRGNVCEMIKSTKTQKQAAAFTTYLLFSRILHCNTQRLIGHRDIRALSPEQRYLSSTIFRA